MSESNKFTPGPWVRSSESPKIIMSGSFIDGHDGYMIGYVTGNDNSGFYASEEEAAANATLMIAAPDLLEALELVEQCGFDDEDESGWGVIHITKEDWIEIKCAISKARGQQ